MRTLKFNFTQWIKTHWVSSFPILAGATIPIADSFLNIWAILGKVKPISGFPLWLILVMGSFVIVTSLALLFTRKKVKPTLLVKENSRDWIKYATYSFATLLAGVLVANVNTYIANRNNLRMFENYISIERQYLTEGTHGLKEYYEGNYKAAYDSLRLYCNSDPVSACYYAEMIFDGYVYGVEQHETTNAIRLMEAAASRNFYRAMFKMQDYYYRQDMKKEAMNYAELLLKRSHELEVNKDEKRDSVYYEQLCRLEDYCTISHGRFVSYLVQNNYDESDIEETNKWYWNYMKVMIGDKTAKISEDTWNVWGAWRLGDKSAEDKALYLAKKYRGEAMPARLYADILLDNPTGELSKVEPSRIQTAEKYLIYALKGTSYHIQRKPLSEVDRNEMIYLASYLSELYDSTGYRIEAAEMNHLVSGLKLTEKYLEYEKKNK